MRAFFLSMAGRVFMILVVGVVVSAAVTLALAEYERRQQIREFLGQQAADRVAQIVADIEQSTGEARDLLVNTLGRNGVRVDLDAGRDVGGIADSDLTSLLVAQLPQVTEVQAWEVQPGRCLKSPRRIAPRIWRHGKCHLIALRLHDTQTMTIALRLREPPPRAQLLRWPLSYPVFFIFCVSALAYVVSRMATRPLSALAAAATDFGRNVQRAPLAEQGPFEVRRAAAAFNQMQTQIRRHLEERTQMLAAIAHDLQTPLTRLRLRLEKVGDEALRGRLVEDLAAMQLTIREGLDLARSLEPGEPRQMLDLDALLASVCDDALDSGFDVEHTGTIGTPLAAPPNAVRRCLTNLIDNAVKYGHAARVDVDRDTRYAIVRIRDKGPGIPDSELEAVFKPFYRLEASRSRETGGTGLGLAIARNIAEKLGGTLRLTNPPQGGLEATLTLPLCLTTTTARSTAPRC